MGKTNTKTTNTKKYNTMEKLKRNFADKYKINSEEEITQYMSDLATIAPRMLFCFPLFFIGGYLLYGSLFAAIGAAVDSESDTQQFMFPITIPLVLSIILSQAVISNPDSTLSYWLSIIPLTSPVIMMMRIPFGVPPLELFISIGLLITGFIFTTWIASKIYRTGILRYGKKTNYTDLFKWITKH